MNTAVQTSKRNFLKGALAAGTAFGPLSAAHAIEWTKSVRWAEEADVVVVGFGGAGASAAIAAEKAGASVLVLEKMPEGGGNTRCSGGGFIEPANADYAFEYLAQTFSFCDSEMDADAVKAFCREAVSTKAYLKELDPDVQFRFYGKANYPELPHAETITKYAIRGTSKSGGENFFAELEKIVKGLGIRVWTNAPAAELIRRGEQIVGVCALKDGKKINIKARRGVVLATGGFEYDPESIQNFCQGTKVKGLGNPGNTGDGLRMAMSVGAKLWHMNSYSGPLGAVVPGLKSAVMITPAVPGCIWVNQDGKRFVDEISVDLHSYLYAVNQFDTVAHRYPAIPCWLIFDETARKSGSLAFPNFGYAGTAEKYQWSADCSKEIEAGIVKKAATLEELAVVTGLPASALAGTVRQWNADIAAGDDKQFGRKQKKGPRTVSAPINAAPYYALELYPALLNTQGGPRRNAKAQIVSAMGKPIPRLYSAGELGSIWGTIYQGSSNIAECLVYGRIAGREAAGLTPWKE